MRRLLSLLLLVLLALPARAQGREEAQILVDQAAMVLPELVGDLDPASRDQLSLLLRDSRGVLICPHILRAGFLLGGRGGGCVLLGREPWGWSAPAFYGLGGIGFGLQIGIQDMALMMLVRTERALRALMEESFTLGGDLGISVAGFGATLQGATTAALGADLVSLARARGLFVGASLEGALLSARPGWLAEYYGEALTPRQVVLEGLGRNPGADRLRTLLGRITAPAR
ncbi:lipid-binding SYLF domain-containing protein [Sabulicella rubraurantiaca]|uniref:lipid-binding SYLF domain-containing protein n=1 Tax=Sabulicella rubraurantiaca TaxID=2811429 RepID=UPI001A9667E5|nr:lipid-binding SYLF domain-containing protein [Sabulicella rubraurantiaca]